MNINYKRLFNLGIGHNYFGDGYGGLVNLLPTIETEKLLRRGKMLLKSIPHGITVLYRADDDEVTPFVRLASNQHFVFSINSDNKSLLNNITDLDESVSRKYSSQNILYFTNNPLNASSSKNNPEIINHVLLDSIQASLFTYRFKIESNPPTVLMRVTDAETNNVSIGKDTEGTPFPTTLTLTPNSAGVFSQQVDLRNAKKGRYTITILDNTGTTTLREEKIYIDDALVGKGILGIVDIVYESTTDNIYGNTEEYRVQFRRAQSLWKYYILNKSDNIDFNIESLAINDGGSINGSPYSINSFEKAYAGIKIEADSVGTAGNLITTEYTTAGSLPVFILSGETLTGGTDSKAATAIITLVNNTISGYTLSINGVDFTEGTDFNNDTTPEDTANDIISAINGNGSVGVTASLLGFDLKINDMPSVVFRSTENIPFYEKPKTQLQLRKVSDDQVIVPNLPNPPHRGIQKMDIGSAESETYVFI